MKFNKPMNNKINKINKINNKSVRLVLMATRACNLKCKYCFVKMIGVVMDKETLKKSIDFLFTSQSHNLHLQYFGGEPLMLPKERFKWSVKYAIKKSKEYKKNLKIIITTNATLLDKEKINFLKKYKNYIVIEVSLDGNKKSHNVNRPQKISELDSYSLITKHFPILIKSGLYVRISMVVSPLSVKDLLSNFEHLLSLGFNKIWIMLACGVYWSLKDINEFRRQLNSIAEKYYQDIKTGKILLMNLRDWLAPYRMNSELIIGVNGKIYPACMDYLVDDVKVKEKYCLGDLNRADLKNIDYYEEKRISNQEAIDVFFKVNKIIPNYESNVKTGMMINEFVRTLNRHLRKEGVDVLKLFNEYNM